MRLGMLFAFATLLAGCISPATAPLPAPAPAALPAPRCDAPCRLLVDDGEGSAFEPMVAVDPRDPQHIVIAASEHTAGAVEEIHRWNKAYVSTDGGATWQASRIPGGLEAGPRHPLFTATDMGDAVAAFLPDGTVLFAGLALNFLPFAATAYTLYVARSADGGLTWPEVGVVAQGRGAALSSPAGFVPAGWFAHDKPWLSVGPDATVLLTWSPIDVATPFQGSTDLMFSTSRDGRGWSEPAYIVQGHDGGSSGSSPVIGPSGTWYVAFMNFVEKPTVFLAASLDQGATWGIQTVVEQSAWGFPVLRAGPFAPGGAERLFLAYAAEEDGREVPVLIVSDDGGASWTRPLRLDEPDGEASWIQVAMDVAVDGTVHAGFFHGAADGALEYRAASAREGALLGWAVLDTGLKGSTDARGHYTGIAALPQGAFATWATGGEAFADPALDLAGALVRLS